MPDIAKKHGLVAHAYADDLQLYGHSEPFNKNLLELRMSRCVAEIQTWMASNRLLLNPLKTEVIWLGSPRRLKTCAKHGLTLAEAVISPSDYVRDLGVLLDGELSLSTHINRLTSVCYYNIRQLRSVRRCLTLETAHALVRALVHSRLDYCSGVLAGLPQLHLCRLQSLLRVAARLVLRLPSRAPVTELMRDRLHWLPFPQRIDFKLCCVVYKCLHGLGPAYLTQQCIPVASEPARSHLRSSAKGDLVIPPTRTKTLGRRGFYYAGPFAWNRLPTHLKIGQPSLATFKKCLKTFLFLRE